jgi:hypothetical protein
MRASITPILLLIATLLAATGCRSGSSGWAWNRNKNNANALANNAKQ